MKEGYRNRWQATATRRLPAGHGIDSGGARLENPRPTLIDGGMTTAGTGTQLSVQYSRTSQSADGNWHDDCAKTPLCTTISSTIATDAAQISTCAS